MVTHARARVGIVLSGGGSRGAYEAGIVQYLRTDLAQRLGRHVPIDIVTGTSVGAINAAFLASTMDDPVGQCRRLIDAWRALRIEELIGLGARDLWRATKQLVGREPPPPKPGSFRYGGLLDTSGLERFVVKHIPWAGIDRNLRSGVLHAMSVSATHVGSGHTVVFVSSAGPVPTGWSKDPFVRHQAARIGPRHVLASAAIPLLFPSVKIGDAFYTDGGLRQNTPMSPAIRLGADRMLMVSLRHIEAAPAPAPGPLPAGYPQPLFLLGKALNALMLDHTEYDLDRMKRINAILAAGTAAFGPDFVEVMNRELIRLRGAPLRSIEAMHIRPSTDIGMMASTFVHSGKLLVSSPVTRRLIERLADRESGSENDLLSYLLFDGNWASELIELGHKDAAAQEDELVRFFTEPAAPAA
ncbi:MAG: patatin-like phospholipase family protein [Myxococcales bacterium]|nr:patatin-like phospholipase family protein [Myxococcales bacterium]